MKIATLEKVIAIQSSSKVIAIQSSSFAESCRLARDVVNGRMSIEFLRKLYEETGDNEPAWALDLIQFTEAIENA